MAMQYRGGAPAQGTQDIARMVDIQTALSGYNPVAATRKGYYALGGATNTGTFASGTTAMRIRFILTVQPTRYRIHSRNYLGLSDFAATTAVTMTGAAVGMQHTDPTKPWDYASTPATLGGNTGTAISGLTEYVSAWQTPTYDMTANESLVSLGFTYTANSTSLVYGNGSHAITIDDATKFTATTVGTVGTGASATAWYDYNYAPMESWIEYEFQDDSAMIGLVIGHSMADGTQFSGGTTPGWDGQMTGWVQQHARRSKHAVTANAFATAKTTDWTSATSTKWTSRFTDLLPDYVIIQITENDITGTTATAATIDTNLRTIIGIVATRYPAAAIYVATTMPIKPNTVDATKEATRLQVIANMSALMAGGLIRGLIDFTYPPSSIRADTTLSGGIYTTTPYRDTIQANLLGADGQHLNPLGMAKLADAAGVAGSSVLAINPARGPVSFTPSVGSWATPQGVSGTTGAAYFTAGVLRVIPFTVGPQGYTVDAVGYNVTTAYSATATTLAVGIYRSGPDGLPQFVGGPIATATQSLNSAAVGAKTATLAAPVYLTPGTYWIAVDITGTSGTAGALSMISAGAYSLPSVTYGPAPAFAFSGVSAALPTAAVALSPNSSSVGVHIGLRRSA